MRKVMLIDGHSIINRAFYAMPILTNKEGIYTNAVFGFLNMLYKFVDDEKPDYLGVAFDLNIPTRRHEQFKEYKGNRKPMPNELRPQIPLLKELLSALNILTYELPGFEADDILGTLAKKAEAEGYSVVIVSGDRDLLQTATERIKIKIPKTKAGKTEVLDYNEKEVVEQYGVTPIQFIDVKALMGDASDNIPGVKGIGEKTAVKIIQQYGSLEKAIENSADIKPKKAAENLAAEVETAILSKSLATIDIDAPIEFKLQQYEEAISKEALELLKKLEFNAIIKRLKKENIGNDENKQQRTFTIIKDIDKFCRELIEKAFVAFYVFEHFGNISGISFCYGDDNGFLVEIETPFDEEPVLAALTPFFESSVKKSTLDAKRSLKILLNYGVHINNIIFDAAIAGYVLEPTKQSYSLDRLMRDYLGEYVKTEEDVLGKGKSKTDIFAIDENSRVSYCCGTANGIFRLYNVLAEQIEKNGQSDLLYNIEMPLINVLFDMECAGIKVDSAALSEYGKMLTEKINCLTSEIYELAGKEFNINSTKQMSGVLFEDLALTPLKRTKTGYSTDMEELERLKTEHPIIEKIIDYRTFSKLNSTYVEGLLTVIGKDGKLHTTFNQTVTATGRLSSTEPNLQNIPIRIALGRELRKVFVPDSDEYVFVDADYSQIELRVLAHLSEDEKLIEAFKSGLDIHRLTASQVNDMPYELITPGLRSAAKAVNFGIIYGISAYSLSIDLGITKKEAEKYIDAYFAAYPKIKTYLENAIKSAKETGIAKTMMGRTRPIPELNSPNYNVRGFGERVAMNMPIQGTAADIIKIAMIKVYNALSEKTTKSRMLLQVHDELLIMAHKDEAELVTNILKTEMEAAVQMLAPLLADVHTGETWFDAK